MEDETCVYECTGEFGLLADLLLPDFLLGFCLFFPFLDRLARIWVRGILVNSTSLGGGKWLDLLLVGTTRTCVVNFSLILLRNVFWPSLTSKLSYPPLKIDEMSSNATLPNPVKHRISSSL